MIVACVALGVALGGTATAGVLMTGANVKNGSLTGADIKDGSLSSRDLAASVRRAMAAKAKTTTTKPQIVVIQGSQGPPGPQGPAGPIGQATLSGGLDPKKVFIVPGDVVLVNGPSTQGQPDTADVKEAEAKCPPNTVVIAGGHFTGTALNGTSVADFTRNRWVINADGRLIPFGAAAVPVQAFAICVSTT